MGKLRVQEFVSLDGVFEDPSWTAPYGFTDAMGASIARLTTPGAAMLLGRVTFEMFAPAWSARTNTDDPGVAFFNGTTKHVITNGTVDVDAWQNSREFGPYDADAVRALKAEGDVYVSGSGSIVRALLADRLVDELHLLVYPVVLGTGRRLFPDGTPSVPLALAEHETYDNGVAHLVYGPAA